MKKILFIILSILLCASMSWGDEAVDGLPDQASEQVRTRTRDMVRAGVPEEDAVRMTRMMVQNRFQDKNILRAQQTVIIIGDRWGIRHCAKCRRVEDRRTFLGMLLVPAATEPNPLEAR